MITKPLPALLRTPTGHGLTNRPPPNSPKPCLHAVLMLPWHSDVVGALVAERISEGPALIGAVVLIVFREASIAVRDRIRGSGGRPI